MTSISSASSSWQHYSQSQMLKKQLQQDVTNGQVSSTDQTALSNALSQIQTSLQSGSVADSTSLAASTTTAATTTPPTPDQLQSKVSSLIDAQVSAGTLTSSQATELKGLFQQTFGADGTTGVQGHHGGHGHHQSAPATDTDGDSDSSTAASTTSTSTDTAATLGSTTPTSASSSTDPAQLINQFLANLQAAQGTAYGAAGTAAAAASNVSSLLLDVTA